MYEVAIMLERKVLAVRRILYTVNMRDAVQLYKTCRLDNQAHNVAL